MARKQKLTLEYIQFDCVDKTTLKRLYRKFGIHGRLFWYELLRLLGRTENYILDLSDPWILEDILEEELFVEKELGIKIVNCLAQWGNIDIQTWENHKNVWCQSLIERHIDVFKKRNKIPVNPFTTVISAAEIGITGAEIKADKPMEEVINAEEITAEVSFPGISVAEIGITGTETLISDAESTQSKVNKSKVKEKDDYVVQKEKKPTKIEKEKLITFKNQLATNEHDAWRESLYMNMRLKKGRLGELAGEFVNHLIIIGKDHLDVEAFKHHFYQWLLKRESSGGLGEYKKISEISNNPSDHIPVG